MEVEIKLDAAYPSPKALILTEKLTPEIELAVRYLSREQPQLLTGMREGRLEILEPSALIRCYAAAGKVYAVTEGGEYTLRLRLYELEERLDPTQFVRISNSEIIRLQRAKSFDLSLAGTICVRLSDGSTSYVSRRYMSRIKQLLGI